MTEEAFAARLRELCAEQVPLPAGGATAERHERLMSVGREDLSLAKLVEAHWDAVAILAEAGRETLAGRIYGVWASEIPGTSLQLQGNRLSGTKMFCSGAGLVDVALVTVGDGPLLVLLDMRANEAAITLDGSGWKTRAFALTATSTITLKDAIVADDAVVGAAGWYLQRPGFWNGAIGPAACWAGGAQGLLDVAMRSKRADAHTMAHLGAMHADVWALECYLKRAGFEIDAAPQEAAMTRALTVRHLVEQACTNVLERFARAYGPYPLAMDEVCSRRWQELNLYLRQSHAERDLESLGRSLETQ